MCGRQSAAAQGTVIGLRGTNGAVGAAVLGAACAVTAMCSSGCAVTASAAAQSPASAHVAAATASARRYCAYEIDAATAAEESAINRFWTPLARSALTSVSRGKMLVQVPKRHLSPEQRRALGRAEWAERTISPKPQLVCEQLPSAGTPRRASTRPPQ
jgi:hypothetical protein